LKVEQWRKVTSNHFEDLKAFTTKKHQNTNGTIRTNNPTDEEVQGIVARVLSNQDEVKNYQIKWKEKLLELFKEKQIQQLKKLLMTNLLLCLTEINSKKLIIFERQKNSFGALYFN
jgi:hypothetical protein